MNKFLKVLSFVIATMLAVGSAAFSLVAAESPIKGYHSVASFTINPSVTKTCLRNDGELGPNTCFILVQGQGEATGQHVLLTGYNGAGKVEPQIAIRLHVKERIFAEFYEQGKLVGIICWNSTTCILQYFSADTPSSKYPSARIPGTFAIIYISADGKKIVAVRPAKVDGGNAGCETALANPKKPPPNLFTTLFDTWEHAATLGGRKFLASGESGRIGDVAARCFVERSGATVYIGLEFLDTADGLASRQ